MGRVGRPLLIACFPLALILVAFALAGSASAAERCDGVGAPTTTVYLPNVTKTLGGPAGWVTPIYVQNSGTVQTTVELSFFRFRDGSLVACHKTADLAPGTSLVDNPNEDIDLPDDTQFSVVARSFGAPVVAIVNELQGSGPTQQALSYGGFTQGDLTVYLPNVTRRFFGYDVPFIVQDLGPANASVTAKFISFDGRSTFTRTFVVAPGRSGVVDPDFEPAFTGAPNSGLVDGTQYAVTLTSTQPIGVVVNAHNEAGAPVAFSHNGIGRGATTLYAPYAAKGAAPDNAFSPIVVQNLGTTPADAQLFFMSSNASVAPQTFTLRAIPAGGAQAFDPRFTLGTTTLCAAASATCLGNGEFSLRLTSANPIAAVVLPNSATTAAGYLASEQLTQRALIPTALRRIGGANGWSTRMVAFTAGPANLTVRAFDIASGDVKARFAVSVAQNGYASFDLGSVAGLVDNAQYSVTIDGGGVPLTAIGLERAATGGDAFMIFEGFGSDALNPTPMPASIRVSKPPATITATWTQQFTATVKDQFGGAMPEQPVGWTVSSAPLGSVSQAGLFTAGAAPATGALLANAGQVTSRVPITVTVPGTVTQQGMSFYSFATGFADVFAETSIGLSSTQRIVTVVDSDVTQVQSDYKRTFGARPAVYVNATTTSFVRGVRLIGGAIKDPPTWAGGLCICFDPHPSWVFVNWQVTGDDVQQTTVRHELTHVMQHQIVPDTLLPTWFDEGNARVEEFTVAGTKWWEALQRYRTASMIARGGPDLYPLAEITDGAQWAARSDVDAAYEYAEAAAVVNLIRGDIGMSGELLMFDLMAQGRTFNDAFALAHGGTVGLFDVTLERRLGATMPAIATAPDSPLGAGLTFFAFGLPPNTPVSYSISGVQTSSVNQRTTDAYGFFYTFLADAWAPGEYTMTVIWGGGSVSGTGTKTQ